MKHTLSSDLHNIIGQTVSEERKLLILIQYFIRKFPTFIE